MRATVCRSVSDLAEGAASATTNRECAQDSNDRRYKLMKERPHQSALRKGRFSVGGCVYAVTKCVVDREPLLLPDLGKMDRSEPAEILVASLRWQHEQEYLRCYGYTIMPDHLHLIFQLEDGKSLSRAMQSIWNYSALKINRALGRSGTLWQKAYFERNIRNERELHKQLTYIRENPVRKGYVSDADEWPFSEIHPEW